MTTHRGLMPDGLNFVEILPDEPEATRGYEVLASSSPAAAWLERATKPLARTRPVRWFAQRRTRRHTRARRRVWYAVAAAALAGFVLSGDGAGPLRLPTVSLPLLPTPLDSSYLSLGSRCPGGVTCQVGGRARPDLWRSYQRAFIGTTAVGGGVWYDPVSGTVYSQELDAVSLTEPEISISLVEQRDDRSDAVTFGPTIDYSPRSHGGIAGAGWRSITVTARRGVWDITATLTGPGRHTLPLNAALQWVAAAPLPN